MLEPEHPTPKPVLRQVVGWVLVLPFLVSWVRLPFPFPLGMLPALGVIAASVYGVRFAWHHASRRVTMFALIVTLLNAISWVMLSTASVLMALCILLWLYWYPYFANWFYWNF